MSKIGVLRTSEWIKKNGKNVGTRELHGRFTFRCDFCVARNRFGVDPAIEWNPMEPDTLSSFEFAAAVPEATEMTGWMTIPASDFPVRAGASNDRNWTPPAPKHVCSLCTAQHFPEDDR